MCFFEDSFLNLDLIPVPRPSPPQGSLLDDLWPLPSVAFTTAKMDFRYSTDDYFGLFMFVFLAALIDTRKIHLSLLFFFILRLHPISIFRRQLGSILIWCIETMFLLYPLFHFFLFMPHQNSSGTCTIYFQFSIMCPTQFSGPIPFLNCTLASSRMTRLFVLVFTLRAP